MGWLSKARNLYAERGLGGFVARAVQYGYVEYLRPSLPRRETEYNGVRVRAARAFDDWIPFLVGHPSPTTYEAAIVDALKAWTATGDEVVVVGGGWGVTTVVAARQIGDEGSVTTFEGSDEYARRTRETARLNGVEDRVTVRPAVVGPAIDLKGERGRTERVAVVDLPECDVLELDCEGAELRILENLRIRPRTLIVETHGNLGAPPDEVAEAIRGLPYEIVSREPAEGGPMEESCIADGIYVLTAIRTDGAVEGDKTF